MNQNDFNNQQPVQTVVPQTEPVQPVTPVQPVAPVEPTMVQPPVQPIGVPEKKKNKALPIIIVVLLLLVIGGGVGGYFLFFHKVTAKQVVDGTINSLFSKASLVENVADKVFTYSLKNDVVEMSADLNLDVDGTIQGEKVELKNIGFNADYILNLKAMETSLKASTSQNSKEILNLDLFIKNDVGYINSNIFAQPYKLDLKDTTLWDDVNEYAEKIPEYNSNDLKTISSKTKTFVKNSIKDDYLSQSEGTYTIEGNQIEALKNTITLTTKDMKDVQISIINQILVDSEYLNILAKYEMKSVDDIKEELLDEIEDLKEVKQTIVAEKDKKVEFNIYTTKAGKFNALEVTSDGEVGLTALSNNNVTTIKMYNSQGKVEYELTYDETTKEVKTEIEGYKLTISYKEDTLKFSVVGKDLELNLTFSTKVENTGVNYDFDLNGSYKEASNSIKGSVKLGVEVKKVDTIKTFDVANAKNVEEITEEEQQAMLAKLGENTQGTFIELILDLMNSMMTPSYDYYGV